MLLALHRGCTVVVVLLHRDGLSVVLILGWYSGASRCGGGSSGTLPIPSHEEDTGSDGPSHARFCQLTKLKVSR